MRGDRARWRGAAAVQPWRGLAVVEVCCGAAWREGLFFGKKVVPREFEIPRSPEDVFELPQ